MPLRFAIACLLLASAALAHAAVVEVNKVPIVLEPPQGYCVLGETDLEAKFFNAMRELLRPKNELIQMSAPCDQVAQLNAGLIQQFSRWALVQVVNSGPKPTQLTLTRAQFIAALRQTFERKAFNLEEANKQMRDILAKRSFGIEAQQMQMVGSDDTAAYLVMGMKLSSPGHEPETVAMFGAVTLVKQFPLDIYSYEKPTAPPGLDATEVTRAFLASVISKN